MPRRYFPPTRRSIVALLYPRRPSRTICRDAAESAPGREPRQDLCATRKPSPDAAVGRYVTELIAWTEVVARCGGRVTEDRGGVTCELGVRADGRAGRLGVKDEVEERRPGPGPDAGARSPFLTLLFDDPVSPFCADDSTRLSSRLASPEPTPTLPASAPDPPLEPKEGQGYSRSSKVQPVPASCALATVRLKVRRQPQSGEERRSMMMMPVPSTTRRLAARSRPQPTDRLSFEPVPSSMRPSVENT